MGLPHFLSNFYTLLVFLSHRDVSREPGMAEGRPGGARSAPERAKRARSATGNPERCAEHERVRARGFSRACVRLRRAGVFAMVWS